jgi:hypothetical protein
MQQQQRPQQAQATAGFAGAATAAAAALLSATFCPAPALPDSCLAVQQQQQQQQGSLKRKRGPPPTVLINGHVEYEVAGIIDRLLKPSGQRSSRLLYRIRWRGYGSEADSWQPVENMRHCQQLLQQYNDANGVCM